MSDTVFYLKLISGLGFIFSSFFFTGEYKKNPKRYKYGLLPAIDFLSRNFTTYQRFNILNAFLTPTYNFK